MAVNAVRGLIAQANGVRDVSTRLAVTESLDELRFPRCGRAAIPLNLENRLLVAARIAWWIVAGRSSIGIFFRWLADRSGEYSSDFGSGDN